MEIERGIVKLINKETFLVKDQSRRPVPRDVWARALKPAKSKDSRYGRENLGPWDDFEWGMLNGKLKALRWGTGDEWEMLNS